MTASNEGKRMSPMTVVSDPGVDDLVALLLLEKLAPATTKDLVSTYGNNAPVLTYKSARLFAALAGSKWRVRQGAKAPLKRILIEPWLDENQGNDGLWDVAIASKRKIFKAAKNVDGSLVSLGTLTEIVNLVRSQKIDRITVMGGILNPDKNDNPTELNIRLDIEAAQWFFKNCQESDVTLVTADAAKGVQWTLKDVRRIPEISAMNIWLKRILLAGYNTCRYQKGRDFVLYDPLAIFLMFFPEEAVWERSGIDVSDTGLTRLDSESPSCNVVLRVNDPRAVADRIFKLVFCVESAL